MLTSLRRKTTKLAEEQLGEMFQEWNFQPSMWDVALLCGGHPGSTESCLDDVIAAVLFLLTASVQIIFVYIISSNQFQGTSLGDLAAQAQIYRKKVAHDSRQVDPARALVDGRLGDVGVELKRGTLCRLARPTTRDRNRAQEINKGHHGNNVT